MPYFKYLIFIIFISCIISRKEEDYEKNTKFGNFYELNDYTFNYLVLNTSSINSWILIFYDKNCRHSKSSLINLKRDILIHYQDNKTLKFGIIDTKNKNCAKLTKRFKVKRVPNITLIYKDKMYPYTGFFALGKFCDFITNLNLSNYNEIPKDPFEIIKINKNENRPLSFIEQSKLNFEEYISSFNKPIEDFLCKYNINIKWTNKKTYFSFFIFLIILFFTEYYLAKYIILYFQKKSFEKKIIQEKREKKIEEKTEIKQTEKKSNENIKKIKEVDKKEKID